MEAFVEQGEGCLVEVPIRLPLGEIERLMRIVDRARRAGMMPLSEPATPEATPKRLAAFAGFILTMRRRRETAFPTIEFGEPAWDMLLDLYVQHVEGRKVSVSSLCTASAVPGTTALRWIEIMVSRGHFVRQPDPLDGRRVHINLAGDLVRAIECYLTDTRARALVALHE